MPTSVTTRWRHSAKPLTGAVYATDERGVEDAALALLAAHELVLVADARLDRHRLGQPLDHAQDVEGIEAELAVPPEEANRHLATLGIDDLGIVAGDADHPVFGSAKGRGRGREPVQPGGRSSGGLVRSQKRRAKARRQGDQAPERNPRAQEDSVSVRSLSRQVHADCSQLPIVSNLMCYINLASPERRAQALFQARPGPRAWAGRP